MGTANFSQRRFWIFQNFNFAFKFADDCFSASNGRKCSEEKTFPQFSSSPKFTVRGGAVTPLPQ